MCRILLTTVLVASTSLVCWGQRRVPAPPVNQDIGMLDVSIGNMNETDCRICHVADDPNDPNDPKNVPNRHHMLTGDPMPPDSIAPIPGTTYECSSCHEVHFNIQRDCTQCHTSSPHHTTPEATSGDCQACHGDLVDNMTDDHYIPTYNPSLVTPAREDGTGLPFNDYDGIGNTGDPGNGAGACDYCHDKDNPNIQNPVILTNKQLHHGTGFYGQGKCDWCHDFNLPDYAQIRTCEGCHGPDSLHNIQAVSPNTPGDGTTPVVGEEDAGYGHIGHDDDCWGCHGFAKASIAPRSGPIIPTVYSSTPTVITAGTDTVVTLTGSGFTNIANGTLLESDVLMTRSDGTSVTLTPESGLGATTLAVTIPGDTAPGNYDLQLVKAGGPNDPVVKSNPVVISIIPNVTIASATASRGVVTIRGAGFGGYAKGSITSVTGTSTKGSRQRRTNTATIISWTDTKIKASFRSTPTAVKVQSVFGTDIQKVGTTKRSRS